MRLTVTVRLKGDTNEPDIAAAEVLERLAQRLRGEAPHDFITSGADTLDAVAQSVWERDAEDEAENEKLRAGHTELVEALRRARTFVDRETRSLVNSQETACKLVDYIDATLRKVQGNG